MGNPNERSSAALRDESPAERVARQLFIEADYSGPSPTADQVHGKVVDAITALGFDGQVEVGDVMREIGVMVSFARDMGHETTLNLLSEGPLYSAHY